MTIQWDEKYRVGIDRFDAQHVNFFNILARLIRDTEKGEEAVRQSIDGLLHYVSAHFHDEETLMLTMGYPGYEEHMKEHSKLLEKTQKLYSDMDMGQPASVEHIRGILVRWIREHILTVDQKYVPFFKEKGAK